MSITETFTPKKGEYPRYPSRGDLFIAGTRFVIVLEAVAAAKRGVALIGSRSYLLPKVWGLPGRLRKVRDLRVVEFKSNQELLSEFCTDGSQAFPLMYKRTISREEWLDAVTQVHDMVRRQNGTFDRTTVPHKRSPVRILRNRSEAELRLPPSYSSVSPGDVGRGVQLDKQTSSSSRPKRAR